MSDAVKFEIDTSQWQGAVADFMAVTSRSLADVLNRSAGSVAIKAMMWTPKANHEAIRRDFTYSVHGFKRKGTSKRGKMVQTEMRRFTPLAYALARKTNPGLSGAELAKAAAHIYGKRQASVGYVKYGWVPAIIGFGKRPPSADFVITHEYGDFARATPDRLEAMIENMADMANAVGGQALQIAFDQEAEQLRAETARRLQNAAGAQ